MTAFHTIEAIGKSQGKTNEGFLVCRDVVLARTGPQLYSENEVPVKGDSSGRVIIMRDEEEVFRPETVASLQGKPVTIDHPNEDVIPGNYRDLMVGTVINPRRGTGIQDHLLIGDLMIYDTRAAEAIIDGELREVSVGYDANYEDAGNGRGYQRNIVANHLALVDNGRCGPICRIGDRATIPHACSRDACTCGTHDEFNEEEHPRGEGGQFSIKGKNGHYDVHSDGRYAGSAHVAPGHPFISAVQLEPEFQGKGVGHKIYEQIENDLGRSLVPSPLGLTPQATKFWQKRLASMPKEKAEALINEAKQIGLSYGIKEAHINERLNPLRRTSDAFEESKHPRGQPKNAGQFTSGKGGGSKKKEVEGSSHKETKTSTKSKEDITSHKAVTPDQHQEANHNIYQYLDMVHGATGHAAPPGMDTREGFIQKHGVPYTANAKTYEGPVGPQKACYMNATQEALHNPDRTYVEGYITVHGVPIQHAWTVDKTGQIYDPTIPANTYVAGYFGVPFSTDYVLKSAMKNKTYGIIHHNKTIEALLSGKAKDFKAKLNHNELSADHIVNRLIFADKVLGSIPRTDKIDSLERTALREKIADTVYNHDIGKRARNYEATILLGLPGAGKSTFANPLLDKGAIEIDNDIVKSYLPEFKNGLGAAAVHEEASDVTRHILYRALSNGDNIVWPRVDSPDKIGRDIVSLKKAGYKVHVSLMRVDPDVAVESVIKRFVEVGRYVPPHAIEGYGDSVEESYQKAKEVADSSEVYSRGRTGGFKKVEGAKSGDRRISQKLSRAA